MSQQTDPSLTVKKLSETLCAKDYATSLKCLNDNEYDKTKCQDQFVAYKKCRQVEIVKIMGGADNNTGIIGSMSKKDGVFRKIMLGKRVKKGLRLEENSKKRLF